jgi:hypothetical protein
MKTSNTHSKARTETININEEFMPYHTKPLDSKYRITLGNRLARLIGKRINVEAFKIFVGKNGDILLRPTVSIPSNEAWVYRNLKVIARVRAGLEEAREGKTERVDDLDSFLENL